MLHIRAADLGNPQRSSLASYRVVVEDEDDNSPSFTTATYRAYVKESSVVGTSVVMVRNLHDIYLYDVFCSLAIVS